jgi:hypothetical protein
VSDVQSWLDVPSTNFGWLLLNADEKSFSTFRVFYSRQVATAAWQPQLEITYVPEPKGWAIVASLLPLAVRRCAM